MSKTKLIVLHGMGVHSAESTKETVTKAANEVLDRYDRFKDVKFEDHVQVIGIGYDDIFEAERKRLIDNNTTVSNYLKKNKLAPEFIKKIVDVESKIGQDKFFYTHAFDVIFYASTLGEPVRLRVVKEIADVWKEWHGEEMHVMAHSLGTSVLHDTLHKAYTGGIKDEKNNRVIKLNTVTHKFDSLWMLANVSNLIFSLTPTKIRLDPFASVVRPSYTADGCTEEFYNYWHVLDIFTLFHKFAPKNNGSWIPEVIYDDLFYQKDDGIKYVGGTLNGHDLYEYITNPYVSFRLLKRMLPKDVFDPSEAEIKKADKKYKHLEAESIKLANRIKKIKSIDDLAELSIAAKEYEDYLKKLKKSIRG